MDLKINIRHNMFDKDVAYLELKADNVHMELDTLWHFYSKEEWKEVADVAIAVLDDLFQHEHSEEWAKYINKKLQLTDYLPEGEEE